MNSSFIFIKPLSPISLAVLLTAGWFLFASMQPSPASAEDDLPQQLWGNVILGFPKGDTHYYEVDFEGQIQISGGELYRSLSATPLVEFYPNKWFDLIGEMALGYTAQSDTVNNFEITPRIGIRFYFLNNFREWAYSWNPVWEKVLFSRIAIANLLRLESRNFYYSDGSASHNWRLRDRLEFRIPFNHPTLQEDRTLYGLADAEFFFPLGNETEERFANKRRFRAGLGYRFSRKYRLELLYIVDQSRETLDTSYDATLQALDLKLKLFF